jgi:hypothetical protein
MDLLTVGSTTFMADLEGGVARRPLQRSRYMHGAIIFYLRAVGL